MEFLCTDFVTPPECRILVVVQVVVRLIILGREERVHLFDEESAPYLRSLVVTVVLLVTDLQYELFCLPLFL